MTSSPFLPKTKSTDPVPFTSPQRMALGTQMARVPETPPLQTRVATGMAQVPSFEQVNREETAVPESIALGPNAAPPEPGTSLVMPPVSNRSTKGGMSPDRADRLIRQRIGENNVPSLPEAVASAEAEQSMFALRQQHFAISPSNTTRPGIRDLS